MTIIAKYVIIDSIPIANPYGRTDVAQINKHLLLDMLSKDDDWAIMISPDPDAIASALALKRIFARRVRSVAIEGIFPVSRPDNLAMLRYLKIPLNLWTPEKRKLYSRFAIVDSQPHHNKLFNDIPFDVVIDHHPIPTIDYKAPYIDIQPNMGATSTILSSYLKAFGIRPGIYLATALQYGIRTDTAAFTRTMTAADINAYLKLSYLGDALTLTRIMRSEYLPEWLPYFTRAFATLHRIKKGGFCVPGEVKSADLLVVIADFFTRVSGMGWIAVGGVCQDSQNEKNAVVIFRGDGRINIGSFAAKIFGDIGTAGGHQTMARAEFPLSAIQNGTALEVFLFNRLTQKNS